MTQFFDNFLPLLAFATPLLFGILFEFGLWLYVKKIASKTTWSQDEIIVEGLKGQGLVLAVLVGVRLVSLSYELPAKVELFLSQGLVVVGVVSLTYAVVQIVGRLVDGVNGPGIAEKGGSILSNLLKLGVLGLGALVVLQTLGVSVTPIITALGIGGLAVALALQDTLSNLFAGLHILVNKQVRIGDFVRLDDQHEGHVKDVSWRNTLIQTLAGNIVVVPNSKLSSAVVTNFSLHDKLPSVTIQVCVAYQNQLDQVLTEIKQAAQRVMDHYGPVRGQTVGPNVVFNGFVDNGVGISVKCPLREFGDQGQIKHELVLAIHQALLKASVEFIKK